MTKFMLIGYNVVDSTYIQDLELLHVLPTDGKLCAKGLKYWYILKWSEEWKEWAILAQFDHYPF